MGNLMMNNTPLITEGETLGVIGAGVMGRTLLHGLFDSGVLARDRAWAAASSERSCQAASEQLGISVVTDSRSRIVQSGLILICVKPKQTARVIASLREGGLRQDTLLISIMAGVTVAQLESGLGTDNPSRCARCRTRRASCGKGSR
jgi:pyrroline-5-carboxylate reductase